MGKRIESIDLWKGITILSVLNIHTCFWSGSLYLPDWTRRIALLIDVPVFFFISGYLLQSIGYKDVLIRVMRQFRRLITDYAVVAIAAIVMAVTLRALLGMQPLFPEPWVTFTSILTFRPTGPLWDMWRVFGGSLWFLQVYLSILPLGGLVLSFFPKRTLIIVLFLILSVYILISKHYLSASSFLLSDARTITFYLSLFLAGSIFKIMRDRLSIGMLFSIWLCLGILSFISCYQANTLPDLQANKFPPAVLYLLFSSHSVMMLCLLIYLEEKTILPANLNHLFSFVSWCGKNVYRIYLWQGIVTSAPFFFIPKMINVGIPTPFIYFSMLVWNVCVSLILTYCHNSLVSALMGTRKGQQSTAADATETRR